MQAVLGVVLLLGAAAMFHFYAPATAESPQPDDLQKQVHALSQQVSQLEKEQAMPALVLNRYRNSIGYIYGVYQWDSPTSRRPSGLAFPALDFW